MTAEQLLAFRHKAGLTQAGLAALLDICKRNVEYYEKGEKPIPRIFALACVGLEKRKLFIKTARTT